MVEETRTKLNKSEASSGAGEAGQGAHACGDKAGHACAGKAGQDAHACARQDDGHDGRVAALEADLARALDARSVALVPTSTTVFVTAVQLGRETTAEEQSFMGHRVVARGAEVGFTLLPTFYGEKATRALDEVAGRAQWLGCLGRGEGADSPVSLVRGHGPARARHLLAETIRDHLTFFDFIRRSALFPRHLALGFCAVVIREALALLFAARGAIFTGDAAAVRYFEEEIAGDGYFEPGDVGLYFQFVGLAEQARHYHLLTGAGEPPFAWMPQVERACRFLEAFDRLVRDTLTTPRERRRLRRRRMLLGGGAAVVLLAALVFYFVFFRPQQSKVDPRLITAPGGIVGQYHSGTNFNRKVLERVDNSINLVARGSPATGVGADHFSVRWQGYINFPSSGATFLCAESDDGVRVWFNDALLLEDWTVHPRRKACERVRVRKGWYPLKIEFFDKTHGARMRLLMGKSPATARPVPSKQLCCRDAKKATRAGGVPGATSGPAAKVTAASRAAKVVNGIKTLKTLKTLKPPTKKK